MKYIIWFGLFTVTIFGSWFAYQKLFSKSPVTTARTTLKIAGSGSTSFALKSWADYYTSINPQVQFEFLPSTEAALGISGIKENTLDIGVTPRKVKPEEEFAGFIQTKFARDAVVFVVNSSVEGVTNLSGAQLADIYTGKITNWDKLGGKNAKIVVIDREEKDSAKITFRNLYLKDKKVSPQAVQVLSDAQMLSTILSTSNSLGYLSYGRAKPTKVIILSLNGQSPVTGMNQGNYPLVRDHYIITKADSPQAVADFVKFIEGEGKKLTKEFYYFE